MQPKDIEEYQKQVQKQKESFKLCFSTDAGKVVLQALREEFYDCRITPDTDLAFICGQRDVVQQILERLEDER